MRSRAIPKLVAQAVVWMLMGPLPLAQAQSDPKQDHEQCLKAQTPAQCEAALPACQRVLAMQARILSDPKVDAVHHRALSDIARCEYQLGRYALSEGHYREKLALDYQLHGSVHPDVAQSLNNLATVLSSQGKYAAAETLFRQALVMKKSLLGAEHPDVAMSLSNLASLLSRQGKYEAAETLFRQALEMRQKQQGAEHPDVAVSLNNLAIVLSAQGKYGASETLTRQALVMKKRLLGTEHIDVAQSLNSLAGVLELQGKYQAAESLFEQALEMRQKLLGAEHPDVAASISNLASVLERQGKYQAAEMLHRQALVMAKKLLGAEHPDVAASTNNLASVLSSQGKYEAAEMLHRQALEMRQKLLGTEHPDVALSLNNLAGVLTRQGKYEAAETLNRQALAMAKKLLGAEHPDVARSLNNLASVLFRQGKYEAAEALFRQALEMRQKLLGTEHPDVAVSLNNLANVFSSQGKYEAAETLARQALVMKKRLLGAEHLDVAVSLTTLAWVLSSQGKYQDSESQYLQALETRKRRLGAEHPDVAASLSNLGSSLYRQGKHEAAETLHRQALAMRQKLLGAEHPDVAASLSNLALVLASQGKYEGAETLFRQALAMRQRLLGTECPDVAKSLNNLAGVLELQGKYEGAETLFRQALEMRQKLLGAEHPDVAVCLSNLATVFIRREQFSTAVPLLTKAAQIEESVLRATSSETRMRSALGRVRGTEDVVYGLLMETPHDQTLKRLAMTTALLRKGRASDAGTMANRVLQQSRSKPETKQRYEQWQQVRQQREALVYGGGGNLSPVGYQTRLRELSMQADELESELAAVMPELRMLQPPKFDEILAAVAARLPKRGMLFELMRTEPYNFQAKGTENPWKAPHYMALVMTDDQQIVVRDLGDAATVDGQVQNLLSALRTPASDPVQSAKALYEQVLKPVLPESAQHVYLSLDGALNLIPFDALHDGSDYLQGRRIFHYLTSGRDLLRLDAESSKQAALVLADPDFGTAAKESPNIGAETFYRRLAGLNRLSGAQEEAKQIGHMLRVTPLVGTGAKEPVVRATQAPWVLHIASHGLFLSGRELPRSGGRGGAPFGSSFSERKGLLVESFASVPMEMYGDSESLSRSALVLADAAAGAKAKSTAEDGLLTAEEARSLDLFGTQLVVLSACDTGRGELSVGQGVYGLRRAFLVAGAETLVTSLWQVSDTATGKLMQRYYEKLLKEKKGRLEGMQEAMKEMREEYKHPYYWAPFLVIGSDGPLRPPTSWSQP